MMTATTSVDRLGEFVGVLRDERTYRKFGYLLVSMPLGALYYLLLVVGLVFGVVFSVFLVGVPVFLATLLAVRYLAEFERRLANRLLDTDIARAPPLPSLSEDGARAAVGDLVRSGTTWRGVAFLVVKSLVGFLTWLFGLVAAFTALALLLSALGGTATIWDVWTIDTLPERVLALPLAALLAVTAAHVLVAIADHTGTVADALLGAE